MKQVTRINADGSLCVKRSVLAKVKKKSSVKNVMDNLLINCYGLSKETDDSYESCAGNQNVVNRRLEELKRPSESHGILRSRTGLMLKHFVVEIRRASSRSCHQTQ